MDKNRLLGDAERRALIGIPEERDQLVRLYTFEADDLALIAERRDDANQLGVALQIALLRHPGMTLAGWLQGSCHAVRNSETAVTFFQWVTAA